ncbi:MAG: TlpA disulfide reductase family protein [Nitrospiraceae bacterium]|nr:TlpA disulfide reductase family protein [Nitrospiraceae bacterium]
MAIFIGLFVLTASVAFAIKANDPAPSFALRDSHDANFYLSDYVGPKKKKPCKGVILNFFASYCKPCRNELPVLNRLTEEFERKGIVIVLIGFNEDFDRIGELLGELKVDRPVILSDRYGKVGAKYGVRSLPLSVFVDADGIVRSVLFGESPDIEKEFRTKAEQLMRRK